MSTLVLKPAALYAAYLSGRLDAPRGAVYELSKLFPGDDEPEQADLATALAYDFGRTDRRNIDVRQPATMADVVRRVAEAVNAPLLTEEQAAKAARTALGALLDASVTAGELNDFIKGRAPETVVRKLTAGILAAVNGLALAASPASVAATSDLPKAPDAWIAFAFDGRRYAAPPAFYDLNLARLPHDGFVRAGGWLETVPPQARGVERTVPARGARYVDAIEVRP